MLKNEYQPILPVSICIQGKKHIEKKLPCQDAVNSCLTPVGWTVIAMADGVSSSPRSEVAAQTAVDCICEFWRELVTCFDDPTSIQSLLCTSFNYALNKVKTISEGNHVPLGYETTLQVAVVIPGKRVDVMWSGDGGVYVQRPNNTFLQLNREMRDVDGAVSPLSDGPEAWQFVSFPEPFRALLLVTDGVNDAIHQASNPDSALSSLLVYTDSEDSTQNELKESLKKAPFNSINDDISIALFYGACQDKNNVSVPAGSVTVNNTDDGDLTQAADEPADDERRKKKLRRSTKQYMIFGIALIVLAVLCVIFCGPSGNNKTESTGMTDSDLMNEQSIENEVIVELTEETSTVELLLNPSIAE